ncbi:MAG: hypothetical protein KAI44_00365 [Methylococcales bacterium]|nr:hypothetical protein [Methylococcales bacterium]MCK5477346.1 hypothetical protein [Methylococcales bacterium]
MKTLRITTYWTTEQAEDMFTLLDDLKSAIWQSYGEDIVKMHRDIALEQKKEGENCEIKDEPFF